MLNHFLPRQVDNTYHGYKLALWLFAVLVLMRTGIALGCIFNGRNAASSADGIPLDTFTPAGAQAVVSMFAAWGVAQLMISLVCVLVLTRYRGLIPFTFTLLLLEHASRKLVFKILPVVTTATPPGYYINLAIFAIEIAGLALSLWKRRGLQEPVRRKLV